MKKLALSLALLLFPAGLLLGQGGAIKRNYYTTNDNPVIGGATNGIQMANGAGTNTYLTGATITNSTLAGNARWLTNLNAQSVFNIVNYGGVADGVTDNTAAWNAVLADAIKAGGGTIYFPPAAKAYLMSYAMVFPAATTNVIRITGGNPGANRPGDSGTRLGSSAIDFQLTAPTNKGCVDIQSTNNVEIDHLYIRDSNVFPLPLVSDPYAKVNIHENSFYGAGCDGIVFGDTNRTVGFLGYGSVVSGNTFQLIGRAFVFGNGANAISVRDNWILLGDGEACIRSLSGSGAVSSGVTISGNNIECGYYSNAMYLSKAVGWTITGNTFWDAANGYTNGILYDTDTYDCVELGNYSAEAFPARTDLSGGSNYCFSATNGVVAPRLSLYNRTSGLALYSESRDGVGAGMWMAKFNDFSSDGAIRIGSPSGHGGIQSVRGSTDGVDMLLLNPSGGNVGIGTNAPAAELDVSGDAHVSGSQTNGGFFNAQNGARVAAGLTVRDGINSVNGGITNDTAVSGPEIVATTGITLAGDRITTWPTGGGSGLPGTNSVVAYGTAARTNWLAVGPGYVLYTNTVDQSGFLFTNGLWTVYGADTTTTVSNFVVTGNQTNTGNFLVVSNILDKNGVLSADIQNHALYDSSGVLSLNVDTHLANDASGVASTHFNNRTLLASDGSSVMADWSSKSLLSIKTNLVMDSGAGFYGLIPSGAGSNAAGSRVAYLSDVSGGGATNAYDSAAYEYTIRSNGIVLGTLRVGPATPLFPGSTEWSNNLTAQITILADGTNGTLTASNVVAQSLSVNTGYVAQLTIASPITNAFSVSNAWSTAGMKFNTNGTLEGNISGNAATFGDTSGGGAMNGTDLQLQCSTGNILFDAPVAAASWGGTFAGLDTSLTNAAGKTIAQAITDATNGVAHPVRSLGITIDGGGSAITLGEKGYLEVPCACTILSATILADQSGSIAIETWRTNAASFPPTRAGVLFTNYLGAAQASSDSTLANATSLSLASQDRIGFNVITNALSCTRITLQLRVRP